MKDFGREKTRTAKAQLELNVAAAIKDTKNASTNPSPSKGGFGEESPSFIPFKTDFQEKGAGVLLTDHGLVFQLLLNLSPWYLLQTLSFSAFICPCWFFWHQEGWDCLFSCFFFLSFFIILSLGMELVIYNITSVVPC